MAILDVPYLGFGLGLRPAYYEDILSYGSHSGGRSDGGGPTIDWLEIITENYMVAGGKPLYYLDQMHERYPLSMHGVSLSIGSSDPLDFEYLGALKALMNRINPVLLSDHMCWTGMGGIIPMICCRCLIISKRQIM